VFVSRESISKRIGFVIYASFIRNDFRVFIVGVLGEGRRGEV
jgi:hypothetical protein